MERLIDLVVRPRATRAFGAVDLVDDEDLTGSLRFERLAQHEARLRQRCVGSVDAARRAPSNHRQAALDLTAKSAWPGVSTMLIFTSPKCRSRVLGEDRRSRARGSMSRSSPSQDPGAPRPTLKDRVWRSIASTSVVCPWSTCAMIAMLRMSLGGISEADGLAGLTSASCGRSAIRSARAPSARARRGR